MNKGKVNYIFKTIAYATGFFIFIIANTAYAAIDKIVFINDPQTITVGESSAQYQIQLQNSAGDKEVAPDTTYFTLPLEMGDFSSQKDSAIFTASSSIYIATNSSNKYFYFKPHSLGDYIMKITARNKDNTKSWETEQAVKVVNATTSDDISGNNTDTATTTVTTSGTTPVNQITRTITRTIYISVHSDPAELSDYSQNTVFGLSAGRERLAYVGNPVNFTADHKIPKDVSETTCIFKWSYGDGFGGVGEKVSHIYKYQGEYSIVLNGRCDKYTSVSRTIVKVFLPHVSLGITATGDLELKNNGDKEINFGGWEIKDNQNVFILPEDTIVSSGKIIILSRKDTKLYANLLYLFDPSGGEVARIDLMQTGNATSSIAIADLATNNNITLAKAEILIREYKNKINKYQNTALKGPILATSTSLSIKTTQDQSLKNNDEVEARSISTTTNSSKVKSFLSNCR